MSFNKEIDRYVTLNNDFENLLLQLNTIIKKLQSAVGEYVV